MTDWLSIDNLDRYVNINYIKYKYIKGVAKDYRASSYLDFAVVGARDDPLGVEPDAAHELLVALQDAQAGAALNVPQLRRGQTSTLFARWSEKWGRNPNGDVANGQCKPIYKTTSSDWAFELSAYPDSVVARAGDHESVVVLQARNAPLVPVQRPHKLAGTEGRGK